MSTHTDGNYPAGIYIKGDKVREAKDSRRAVALVFDGYKLQEAPKAEEAPKSEEKSKDAPKTSIPKKD